MIVNVFIPKCNTYTPFQPLEDMYCLYVRKIDVKWMDNRVIYHDNRVIYLVVI